MSTNSEANIESFTDIGVPKSGGDNTDKKQNNTEFRDDIFSACEDYFDGNGDPDFLDILKKQFAIDNTKGIMFKKSNPYRVDMTAQEMRNLAIENYYRATKRCIITDVLKLKTTIQIPDQISKDVIIKLRKENYTVDELIEDDVKRGYTRLFITWGNLVINRD